MVETTNAASSTTTITCRLRLTRSTSRAASPRAIRIGVRTRSHNTWARATRNGVMGPMPMARIRQ